MMAWIFWLSLAVIVYTYGLYPAILILRARCRPHPKPCQAPDDLPPVSVVIAAYNEERYIAARIENILSQSYPKDRIQVIVVSDGSTDRTEEIVRSFANRRHNVHLVVSPHRSGKANALNLGVQEATGEILVFADARQKFDPSALCHLVRHFQDPEVGGVTGALLLMEDSDNVRRDIGLYWRYEKAIRQAEGRVDSVVGATGAIYAIRQELFQPIPPETILDDVLIPMNAVSAGYRILFEPEAIAYDRVSPTARAEFRRKVRTLAGNYQVVCLKPALLNPFRNRLWWQFVSHKLMRLAVPFALIALLIANITLWEGLFYRLALAGQALFYMAGGIGYLLASSQRQWRPCSFAYVFLALNLAAMVGLVRFLMGTQKATWDRPEKG